MKLLLRLNDPTIVHQDQPLITKLLDMMWALMQVGNKTYSSRPPDKVGTRLAPVLKTIFHHVSHHILVASLTLMALF